MKYNKRAIKNKIATRLSTKTPEKSSKKEVDLKKLLIGLLAADVIAGLFVAGHFISKKKQKPIDKVTKDLNKKYKKTKKKFTKKADKLLKELEYSASDLMENASGQMEMVAGKAKDVRTLTLDKTKDGLADLQSTLENILKKIKR